MRCLLNEQGSQSASAQGAHHAQGGQCVLVCAFCMSERGRGASEGDRERDFNNLLKVSHCNSIVLACCPTDTTRIIILAHLTRPITVSLGLRLMRLEEVGWGICVCVRQRGREDTVQLLHYNNDNIIDLLDRPIAVFISIFWGLIQRRERSGRRRELGGYLNRLLIHLLY